MTLHFAPLLRRILFIGEPTLGERFDFEGAPHIEPRKARCAPSPGGRRAVRQAESRERASGRIMVAEARHVI
jgi:hypothetical protein